MITLKQFCINNILNCDSKYSNAIGKMLTENQVLALINDVIETAEIVDFNKFKTISEREIVEAVVDNCGDGSFVTVSYKYKTTKWWNEDHSDWAYSESTKYCVSEEWHRDASATIYYADLERYGIAINLPPYLD